MMDKYTRRGVRSNTLVKKTTGVRIGSAKPPKMKLMQPKGFKKPAARVPASGPLTAPRMKATSKVKQAAGKVMGVRGGRKPYKPGFKKSTTTGKPKTYGSK